MSFRNSLPVLIIALLAELTSCKTSKTVVAETPEVSTTAAPEQIKERNELVIPIEMDISKYLNDAKTQVPESYLGSDKPCEGTAYDLYFERMGVKMTADKDKINTQIDGKYWIKLSYCVKCSNLFSSSPSCLSPRIPFSCGVGEPMPKIKLNLETDMQIDKDYKLKTSTQLTDLKSLSACEVTVFHYDITETLMAEMQKALKNEMQNIDKSLGKISFEQSFREVWTGLQNPIEIPGIGYLHFNPVNLKLTDVQLKQNKLFTTLVIGTNSFVDTQKNATINKTLPPLENISKLPHDTFELHTDFKLNYDSLAKIIKPSVVGQRIDYKKKYILLNSVQLSCLNNSEILIRLAFSGSKSGVIFLTGNPVINPETALFTINNLDFELKTKSALLKTAGWMFNDRILKEIQKACTISLADVIRDLKTEINKQLDFKIGDFTVKGKAHELKIEKLLPATDGLYLRSLFKGNIHVKN